MTTSTGIDSRWLCSAVIGGIGEGEASSPGLDPCPATGQDLPQRMNGRPASSLAESIAAAQAWWREAGVDFA
jgi:hypothetical protein